MRRIFLTLALTLLVVASLTVAVKAGNTNFGSATCSRVACPDPSANSSPPDYGSIAAACASRYFGAVNDATKLFSGNQLDGSNCLTSASGSGMQVQCCVTKLQDETCAMHCDQNQSR